MFKLIIIFNLIVADIVIECQELSELEKKFDLKLEALKQSIQNDLSLLTDKYDQVINITNQNKTDEDDNCGSDWVSYSETKCFAVLDKQGNIKEAEAECIKRDSTSTLVTIESKEEQNFLSKLLSSFKNLSDNVWIGLKSINKTYEWIDGNDLTFDNWEEGADKRQDCVIMSITDHSLGKWSDRSCLKKSLSVCQKKQITVNAVKQQLIQMKKLLDKQQKKITLLENTKIPIGFIYTQLPHQSEPQHLWPNINWTEITKDYAGLFFRANGEGSETFGQIQQANYPRISQIRVASMKKAQGNKDLTQESLTIEKGSWSKTIPSDGAINYMSVYTTSDENRPINTAIKIWKRMQ